MSDPLTSLEIQDVLSSIRRLVSEDNRHRADRVGTARGALDRVTSAEDEPDVVADKLVLTEALRVSDDEDAETDGPVDEVSGQLGTSGDVDVADEEAAAVDLAADLPAAQTHPVASDEGDALRLSVSGESVFDEGEPLPVVAVEGEGDDDAPSLEDTIAELEAAVSGRGWEFEPDGSEVAKGALTDAALEEAFENGFGVDEAAEDDEAVLGQPITSPLITDRQVSAEEPATIAFEEPEPDEAGTNIVATTADQSADIPDIDAEGASDFDADDDADETGGVLDFKHADPVDGPEQDPVTPAEAQADPSSGSAFIRTAAAMAAKEAGGRPQPAAQGTGAPQEEPTARPSRIRRLTLLPSDRADMGAVEADAQLSDMSSALPGGGTEEDDASLFSAGDETVVDMDMLRDLVAEIIRQELQGALGERITRNVRMLVRREINRALEGRNFD